MQEMRQAFWLYHTEFRNPYTRPRGSVVIRSARFAARYIHTNT
ncbi:hypothetical protein [Rudanella paleaurantiibacter]|nr:hypothetical protein [Rudanella paleaurantiibacter]